MCGKSARLITKAQGLLTTGDFDEAWRIISNLAYDDLTSKARRIDCSLLKAEILMKKTHYQQAYPFVKNAFQESVENNLPDRMIKGLKLATRCFFCLGLMDEWFLFFNQFNEKELVKNFSQRKQKEYLGTFYHCKGTICWMKGELTAASSWLEKSLALREELGNQKDIAYTINNLGLVYWYQGNLDQAMTFFKQSARIKKRLGEKLPLTRSLENIGIIYRQKGELEKALNYFQKSLKIREKIGNKKDIAGSLENIGMVYRRKGDLQKAEQYLHESLDIGYEIGNNWNISYTLFALISLEVSKIDFSNYESQSSEALEKGELLLKQLKAIAQAEDNKLISQRYRLAKASLLKLSEKEEEQKIAYQIFKEIINEEIVAHELTIFGMINLCEMLFKQYVLSGNQEILAKLIEQLENILALAKEAQRFGIVLYIFLLQGKIFLLQFEIKKAKRMFEKIKAEAKKKGFKLIIHQCKHELAKIIEYSTLDIILSEQNKNDQETFKQQQTEDIFNYLKDVSLQLQTLDKKG